MNIGIDCGALAVSDERLKVGVYQLNLNLLKELSKIDKKNHFWLYSFSPIPKSILDLLGENFENRLLTPETGWLTLRLSLEFLIRKPDLFLGLSQALPLYHPLKSIIFVYDLAFELFPECYQACAKKLHWQTKKAAKEATKIIAVSSSTKDDLVKIYKISQDQIEVVYPGVNSTFSPQSSQKIARIRKKYELPKQYFLFVGSLKPIKNVERILESFQSLPLGIRKNYQMVIAGSSYWQDNNLKTKIQKLQEKGEVKYLGYIPQKDLPALYTGATIFVSPSLYEGFGLPLLEAMTCGSPIITSNVGSMPEVVGEAGIQVNPQNTKEIGDAIMNSISNPKLLEKFKMLCLKRAKMFSWNKFTKEIYNVIEKIR